MGTEQPGQRVSGFSRSRTLAAALFLAGLTLLVYLPMAGADFVLWDDDQYILTNYNVRTGFTAANVRQSLTSLRASNWHPVSWWSHMLDVQLFGLHAGAHHLVNVSLHLGNALLLGVALGRLTGAFWPGVVVAVLFAVHPLHVEPVAWISERKEVLATCFWLLFLLAWIAHLRTSRGRPGPWYAAAVVLHALGLMAKSVLVSVPILLLVLDWWPLNRLGRRGPGGGEPPRGAWILLACEKIPLILLSLASSLVVITAQARGGTVGSLADLPLALRVGNLFNALGFYLSRTFYPKGLHAVYLHPVERLPLDGVAMGMVLVLVLTLGAWLARIRHPFLLAGWLWFLVTLLPMSGLVQVGIQAMADRYTYFPLTGLLVALAWAMMRPGRGGRLRGGRLPAVALAAGASVLLAVLARGQAAHWTSSETLFRRTLSLEPDNHVAHFNLGAFYGKAGDFRRAEEAYRVALDLMPEWDQARLQLGIMLISAGKRPEAMVELEILRRAGSPKAAVLASFLEAPGS
jgi:hypothetical protein